jgi:hypothetical protein
MASKNPKITVTFPPDKMAEVKAYADHLGLNAADFVKYALAAHFRRYPLKSLDPGAKEPSKQRPVAVTGNGRGGSD